MHPEPDALTKFVTVRRSDRIPTIYWWSLPLSLHRIAPMYADQLAGARAVVHPASALGSGAGEIAARALAPDTALVTDIAPLLAAYADGRVAPCTIAIFPPTTSDAELERRAVDVATDLERLPFTIAIRPEGDGRARHWFCFRVPGKVILALEHLALDRGFGGNPGQVEMALLQGLGLRPKQAAHLQIVMRNGGAKVFGYDAGGRRRVTLLESGSGYIGVYEDLPLVDAVRERVREAWRRFPVGVVMFVGLPFFIAAFWIASLARRGQASSGVSVAASSAVGWPAAARSSSTKAR